MRSASDKNKEEGENVIVDTKFGHFREHEIDAKLKEAEQEGPPKIGDGGEVLDTTVNVEKIEKTQGTHAIRWLEQEGQERVFVKELVYDTKTGNKFLTKVFLILLAMLITTAIFNIVIILVYRRTFEKYSGSIILYSVIATMAVNYFWACSAWARVKPHNIIGLVLGVPALSCLIAGFAALWEIQFHLMLAIIGLTVSILICLLLALTPWDFTNWFLYIVVILFGSSAIILALICYIFVGYTFIFAKLHYFFIATTIIFILLVTELRLVLSGRYIEILEDDHALAAWLLYASTFTFILKLVQTFDLVDTD